MTKWNMMLSFAALSAVGMLGCGGATPETSAPDSAYLTASEPQGAVGVGEARSSAADEEEVVLLGRIGGSANPFVDGLAAFTIVDPLLSHCPPEEGCPTPWDYCCTPQDQINENIATVKVVDAAGTPVARDARQLLGVKELSTVVVRGKAQRDEAGNLAVLAHQVYVKE